MEIYKYSNNNIAIKVNAYYKKYSRRQKNVLQNINFTVEKGSFHAFIGPNGVGKTTIIKSLVGAYYSKKYGGEITFFGKENTLKEVKKRIGYIPESSIFPKRISAYSYLKHMVNIAGLNWEQAKKYSLNFFVSSNLSNIKDKNINNFSSGQKKKVLLARSLGHNPDILIMDEPCANLDPKARMEFLESLKKLQKEGKTIFISSHILSEIDKYADSATILDAGKVVFSGSIKDLKANENTTYSYCFFKSSDVVLFEKYLIKMKIKYELKEENEVIAYFKEEETLWKINEFINKAKMKYKSIKPVVIGVEKAYSQYVKKGSLEEVANIQKKNLKKVKREESD